MNDLVSLLISLIRKKSVVWNTLNVPGNIFNIVNINYVFRKSNNKNLVNENILYYFPKKFKERGLKIICLHLLCLFVSFPEKNHNKLVVTKYNNQKFSINKPLIRHVRSAHEVNPCRHQLSWLILY